MSQNRCSEGQGVCIINATNIWDAYQEAINFFDLYEGSESRPALISIADVNCHGMPSELDGPWSNYYRAFIDGNIDSRWQAQPDWYLAYSRRLCKVINGVSVLDTLVEELASNPSSRKAVISTYDPATDRPPRVPALSLVRFGIEDSCLTMHSVWRSRDLVRGLPMGMLAMHSYMRIVYQHLQSHLSGLRLGGYVEFISSLHKRDAEAVDPALVVDQFVRACNTCDAQRLRHIWAIILTGQEAEYDAFYNKLAMSGLW